MDTTTVFAILTLVALVGTTIFVKPTTQGGGSKHKSRKHGGSRHRGTRKHH